MATARRCRMAKVADLIPPQQHAIDDALVSVLAGSIRDHGLREPIVVVGRHILHGVHRWSAAKKLGLKTIEVVDDCKAETAEANDARMIVENLHRRHMDQPEIDRLTKALVNLKTPQIAQEMQQTITDYPGEKVQGRPRQPKSEAIRQVAKETKRTEKAVEHSVRRAEAKETATSRVEKAIASGHVDDTDEYSNRLPAKRRDQWFELCKRHSEIDSLMRKAQAVCTTLIEMGGAVSSYAQRWRELTHEVGHEARSYRPYAVCPKCGGSAIKGKECNLCRGVGFVSDGTLAQEKYEKLVGVE